MKLFMKVNFLFLFATSLNFPQMFPVRSKIKGRFSFIIFFVFSLNKSLAKDFSANFFEFLRVEYTGVGSLEHMTQNWDGREQNSKTESTIYGRWKIITVSARKADLSDVKPTFRVHNFFGNRNRNQQEYLNLTTSIILIVWRLCK